jgi:plasmid stability protein
MPHHLTIRELPDDVHQALRARAARAGLSVEAEVRVILEQDCLLSPKDGGWVDGLRHRARERTAGVYQSDSASLIRAERDARGR